MNELRTHTISFAGSTVALQYEGHEAVRIIEFLFRHIPTSEEQGVADVTYHLLSKGGVAELRLGHRENEIHFRASEGEVAGYLLGRVCEALASHSTGGMVFHASALSWNGMGVMLPGTMEVGKSTLTAWLLSRGYDYLTDEMVYLPNGEARLVGFPRPLNLRRSSRFVWQELRGERTEEVWSGSDFDLVQPDWFPMTRVCSAAPLNLIIFPRYDLRATFAFEPLSKAQAGLELMRHFVNARNLPEAGFPRIAQLVRRVPAYRLRYARFEQIEGRIEARLAPARG
ncbi:MAG TPA: hypothetical protein VF707_03380 [Ardenticatenaceae bacterium]|jgi:hypothetical protein